MHKNTKTTKHLLFAVLALLTLALFVLSVWSFAARGGSSSLNSMKLPVGQAIAASYDDTDGTLYFASEDLLTVYNADGSEKYTAQLNGRAIKLIITDVHIIAVYRTTIIDVLDIENGIQLASHDLRYNLTAAAVDGNVLYAAVRRSGVSGAAITAIENYSDNAVASAVSLNTASAAVDMASDGEGRVLYVDSSSKVNSITYANGELRTAQVAQVQYKAVALGFYGKNTVVFDERGYVYNLDESYNLQSFISLNMTVQNASVNSRTGKAVALNVSGSGSFIDLEQNRQLYKLKTFNEPAYSFVSDSGKTAVIEHRSRSIQFFDFDKLPFLSFLEHGRWFFIALTVIVGLGTAAAALNLTGKGREKLDLMVKNFIKGAKKYFKSYAFILPTFVLLLIFMYIPAGWGLILSFFDYVPGVYSRFVGFENFSTVFADAFFLGGVGNMLIFLFTDLIKALIPAVIFAELILALRSQRGQYVMRLLLYIPGILPGVAALLIWVNGIYGSNGLVNAVVQLFGGQPVQWLGNTRTAIWSLVFIGFPFIGSYILFYGALMSIPASLKESAKLDGCNWIKTIFYIDLPLITPQLKYVFITSFIGSLQNFQRVYLTTNGGPLNSTNIPSLQLYYTLSQGNSYGAAAAMGMLLFIVIFVATLANLKIKSNDLV